jgi:hypothetical protein
MSGTFYARVEKDDRMLFVWFLYGWYAGVGT